jgi:hypothetical protein
MNKMSSSRKINAAQAVKIQSATVRQSRVGTKKGGIGGVVHVVAVAGRECQGF